MKKMIGLITLLIMILGVLILCIRIDLKNHSQIDRTEFYLSSNHTNAFVMENNTYLCVPDANVAPPFEYNIDAVKDSEYVANIVPYHDLYVGCYEKSSTIHVSQGNNEKVVNMPFHVGSLAGYGLDVYMFSMISYYDTQIFHEKVMMSHTFDSSSGVYITEDVANKLSIQKNKQVPVITMEVFVPIKGRSVNELNKVLYIASEYEIVEVEMEVAGIINQSDSFYGQMNDNYKVLIPYDLSCEIVAQVDFSNVILGEGEEVWQSNTFIIQTTKKVDSQTLGENLQQYIHDFMLVEHCYDPVIELEERYLFD